MEAIGNIKPIILKAPQGAALPVLSSASRQPSLPALGNKGGQVAGTDGADLARFERIKNAARNAPQPLGSQSFTLFKDSTGQVITRFRDVNSGRVTYIPEPNLMRVANAGSGGGQSAINITA